MPAMGGTMVEFLYDAFISYRRSDGRATARWLRRQLEAFRPPRALRDRLPRQFRVYLDTAYERGAIDFFDNTIRPALLASRFLIVVATPDAVLRPSGQDDWIKRETDEFTRGPNRKNLLLVRGDGDFDGPLPSDLALRFPHIEIVDLRNVSRFWRLNPLRASRISDELLKLIAPIGGVAAEDMPLLRREQERIQQARIGAAAGVTSAVLVAVSTITVYALVSRQRAAHALETTLTATGSLVRKLGAIDAASPLTGEARRYLINDVCDIFDGLRKEADADARARPLVVCFGQRARDHENLEELDDARRVYEDALKEAFAIHARSGTPDDGRAIIDALDALSGFFQRRGDKTALVSSLKDGDSLISKLQADYPEQASFPVARARRLQQLADLDELQPPEKLIAFDEAAGLVNEAAQMQIDQKRRDLLAWKAELLMSAANMASSVESADGALRRLSTALSATDEASRLDPSDRSANILNGAAISAMQAAIEANRGNSRTAEAARAEARRRLQDVDVSALTDQSDRERLQRIQAALARPADAIAAPKASNR
jgi:hypothetical protein